jgi:hypothetical protein
MLYHETNMPLKIILKEAAQKEMKILFEVETLWHVSSTRTYRYSI